MRQSFVPTPQQQAVIDHEGSAFITACPGAGKTRVMVERARVLMGRTDRRGVAILSFTNAAVEEIQDRMIAQGVLPTPPFPNFVGTFDAFLWQFFVAPFELPGSTQPPKLIPDKDKIEIRPFTGMLGIPLECFDRLTGQLRPGRRLQMTGFNPSADPNRTARYESAAASVRRRMFQDGEIDFAEAREIARERMHNKGLCAALANALTARFVEVMVDEAQDCNPEDLKIIDWLREAGIPTKVICDPHQSIYAFRGGVTDELFRYADSFDADQKLSLSGNFRSSSNICKAIVGFRAAAYRETVDQALGPNQNADLAIQVISYAGRAVPAGIGEVFCASVKARKIRPQDAPILAATKQSCAHASGQPAPPERSTLTIRLASAVSEFHFALESGDVRDVLKDLHAIVLEIGGKLTDQTYHQHVAEALLNDTNWRAEVIAIARQLKYDPAVFRDAAEWHTKAKQVLAPYHGHAGRTIGQTLQNSAELLSVLMPSKKAAPPRTIHSVKGREYPGVCVVLTTSSAKGILEYLETGAPAERAESAREIYVAASRAERFLAIAVPKSQAKRLEAHLTKTGAKVEIVTV